MNTLYRILIFILVFGGMSLAAKGENERGDTLLNVVVESKVVITETSAGTTITVNGMDGEEPFEASVVTEYGADASVTMERDRQPALLRWINERTICVGDGCSHWDVSVDGLCLGLTDAMGGGGDYMQWSKSIEISWLSCINVLYRFSRSNISLGLGFDWRNYKCTLSDRALKVNEMRGIEWGGYPEGSRPRNSRLKVFSVQFPLLYEWSIPKTSLRFKAGPILNLNTYASVKTRYQDAGGNECEEFNKNIAINKTTVDFFGSLSWNRTVGIYVRYSPANVLKSHSPINFNPLTLGFTLFI